MSKRKSIAKAKLKATSQQERIQLWKQRIYSETLRKLQWTNHENLSKTVDIKLGPFTQEELDLILRKIKNRKVAGLHELPPEVWKTKQLDDILLRHCNAVYNKNPIDRWTKRCILPIPKEGDPDRPRTIEV